MDSRLHPRRPATRRQYPHAATRRHPSSQASARPPPHLELPQAAGDVVRVLGMCLCYAWRKPLLLRLRRTVLADNSAAQMFIPIFYVQVFVQDHGASPTVVTYAVRPSLTSRPDARLTDPAFVLQLPILNAAACVARVSIGFAADRFGNLTVAVPVTTLIGCMIFAMLGATSTGGAVAFCVVFGAASGAWGGDRQCFLRLAQALTLRRGAVTIMAPSLISLSASVREFGCVLPPSAHPLTLAAQADLYTSPQRPRGPRLPIRRPRLIDRLARRRRDPRRNAAHVVGRSQLPRRVRLWRVCDTRRRGVAGCGEAVPGEEQGDAVGLGYSAMAEGGSRAGCTYRGVSVCHY